MKFSDDPDAIKAVSIGICFLSNPCPFIQGGIFFRKTIDPPLLKSFFSHMLC